MISLDSAQLRRRHIIEEFRSKHIDFEFFDAITPEKATSLIKKSFPNLDLSQISIGELACVASHLEVWRLALSSEGEYVTVFEDDIFLADEAAQFLQEDIWIQKDIHLVKIETFLESVILKETKSQSCGRKLSELKTAHFGAAGYIISKQAILDIFEFLKNQTILKPLDHIIFSDIVLNKLHAVYQMEPALCIQEKILKPELHLESSLDVHRNQFKPKKQKLTLVQKVLREFYRILNKIRLSLFARKISFK